MKKIFVILLSCLALMSCVSEAERQAEEFRKIDSTAKATTAALEAKAAARAALQDSIARMKSQYETWEYQLSQAKADLAAAEDAMSRIKEFQFLRLASTRAKEIRSQALEIDALEKQVATLETNIRITQKSIERCTGALANYR
jgi:predicted  nucleic acid-binding Zn-ribbon protein